MEAKQGYKTTEFWLSLIAMLLGAFVASGALETDHWAIKVAGLALSALTALGYSKARSLTKAAASGGIGTSTGVADPQ